MKKLHLDKNIFGLKKGIYQKKMGFLIYFASSFDPHLFSKEQINCFMRVSFDSHSYLGRRSHFLASSILKVSFMFSLALEWTSATPMCWR